MASKDLKNDINEAVAFNTQLVNSDTTTVGTELDMQGYEGLTIVFQAGIITLGDFTLLVRDCDTSGGTYADVADAFLIGTEALTILDTSNTVSRIGYVGKKRYVKVSVVSANSADGTIGATAIQSSARHNKVS